MAVTWKVVSMDSTKTVGSLSDVVDTIHWTATKVDGDYAGSQYGSIQISEPDSSSFTAYKDITEENAISWAKAAMGSDKVTAIENNITNQISKQKTPTTSHGVPW